MRTPRVVAALCFCTLTSTCGPAQAQSIDAFRPLFEDRLHQQGDSFTLCYSLHSPMADFEKALAAEIGNVLLTDVKVASIEDLPPYFKYDTTIKFSQDQIYILMAQQCDGIMGFVLASGYDSWLAITRPYIVTDNVLVSSNPDYKRLDDIPRSKPLGSRVGSDGDASILAYLQALPKSAQWKRYAYFANDLLLNRIIDGTVGAGVIWESVLNLATGGDPAANGLHRLDAPFAIRPTQVGIAVRANDAYLKTALDDATRELVSDGTVDRLLAEFHIASSESTPQTQQNVSP